MVHCQRSQHDDRTDFHDSWTHTRFAPDRHFGSFKSLFRKTYGSSLPQIAEVNAGFYYIYIYDKKLISALALICFFSLHHSCVKCICIDFDLIFLLQVVERSAKGNTPYVLDHSFVSYDWAGYLTNFYKPLQGILVLHQITASQAGVFTRKNLGDESTSVKLMKANKPLDGDLPAVLPKKGLDAKRQFVLGHQAILYVWHWGPCGPGTNCPQVRYSCWSPSSTNTDETPPERKEKKSWLNWAG